MKTKNYIIVMGDIINSGKLPQPITQNKFLTHIKEVNASFKNEICSPLTITLGDEFQGVVATVANAVKLVLAIEEKLLINNFPYQLRYVINQGKIDTPINTTIAYGMVGEGLTEARKMLEIAKQNKTKYSFGGIKNSEQLKYIFEIFEMFYSNWEKKKEGKLISQFLLQIDYKQIALKMKKTPSLIWKRKKSLHINPYIALKKIADECTS